MLLLIQDKATNGRLRSWTAFTKTAAAICRRTKKDRVDEPIARAAMLQLSGSA